MKALRKCYKFVTNRKFVKNYFAITYSGRSIVTVPISLTA